MKFFKKGFLIFLIFINFFGCLKKDKDEKEPTPPTLKTILVNESTDLEVLENDELRIYIEGESSEGKVYITLSEDWKKDETEEGTYIYQGETNVGTDIILEISLDDGTNKTFVKREIQVKEDISKKEKVNDVTFLIYMAADNDLGMSPDSSEVYFNFSDMDLEEIRRASISDNINIVVYGDFYENKTPGIYVKEGNKLVPRESLGDFNTGDPENLIKAINYVKENYPSSNYVLDIWNHGSGWYDDNNKSRPQKAIAEDYKSEKDSLNLWELEYAIKNSEIPYFDVIYMDACLMSGVEVSYQLKDVGKYLVASSELTPGQGGDYIGILEGIDSQLGALSDRGLAIEIAKAHVGSYKKGGRQYLWGNENYLNYGLIDIVYSVIDLSNGDKMLRLFNEILENVNDISEIDETELLHYNYGSENYFDLVTVLKEIKKNNSDDITGLSFKIDDFINFIENEYVVYKDYQNLDSKEDGVLDPGYEDLSESSGLSIYYNSNFSSVTNDYREASIFGNKSNWTTILP